MLSDQFNDTREQHFDNPWNFGFTGALAFELSYTPVPEPGSAALLALGCGGLAARRRDRRRHH